MATTSLRSGGKVVMLGVSAPWHESSQTDPSVTGRRSVKMEYWVISATVYSRRTPVPSNLTVNSSQKG